MQSHLSNCEYECDKACNIGEYFYYENCKCKKKLVNKLVDNVLNLLKKWN